MKWSELKEFANSLDEKQLENDVVLLREEEAIKDLSTFLFEENQYVNSEYPEDGCMDESEAKSQIESCPDDFPNGMDDFRKVYDKGTPMIAENF